MLVKVFNDNVHPYAEKFKGERIQIAPKGFVEMDFNEASQFLGTMPPNIEIDGNGIQKPTSYKMLRIEIPGKEKPMAQEKSHVCHACNKDLHTKAAYDAHVEAEHLDAMADEDAREAIQDKAGRASKGVKHDAGNDRNSGKTKV